MNTRLSTCTANIRKWADSTGTEAAKRAQRRGSGKKPESKKAGRMGEKTAPKQCPPPRAISRCIENCSSSIHVQIALFPWNPPLDVNPLKRAGLSATPSRRPVSSNRTLGQVGPRKKAAERESDTPWKRKARERQKTGQRRESRGITNAKWRALWCQCNYFISSLTIFLIGTCFVLFLLPPFVPSRRVSSLLAVTLCLYLDDGCRLSVEFRV